MRSYAIAGLVGLVLLLPSRAAAQVPLVETEDVRIGLTGRMQTQLNTSTADSVYSTFELRRARVGVELLIDDWIEGHMEWNFAHTARLEDGYLNLAFHPAFQLQAGQFKKPFSRVELTSSSRIVPIEAGLRIRGLASNAEHQLLLDENVYIGREIGAQVHGTLGPVGYAAGVFNGSDQNNRDVNDTKSFAGRVTVAPFDAPFELGAGASYRDATLEDELGEPFTREGIAIEIDAQWGGFRRPGVYALVELMRAENLELDDPMVGGTAIVAWFQPVTAGRIEGIEPLLRGSYGDPSTELDDDAGMLLTPGVNLYFHGRNRLMLNWDVFVPELDGLDSESALRAQVQLYF